MAAQTWPHGRYGWGTGTVGKEDHVGRSRIVRTSVAVMSALVLMVSVTGWAASERYLSGLSTVNVLSLIHI